VFKPRINVTADSINDTWLIGGKPVDRATRTRATCDCDHFSTE
jgi:hypothetical protein